MTQWKQIKKSFWENLGEGGSFTSGPAFYNNHLYIGSHDRNIYCLTMEGIEKWRFRINGLIPYPPTIHNGIIYFGSFDKSLYAINEEGEKVWQFNTQGVLGVSPTYHNGRIYCGSGDNNVYVVDALTGREIWREMQSAI